MPPLSGAADPAEDVQNAEVYNLLGFTLRKTGDYKTSLTDYTKALELQPDHKAAREYLGELYVETGNMEKAKKARQPDEALPRRAAKNAKTSKKRSPPNRQPIEDRGGRSLARPPYRRALGADDRQSPGNVGARECCLLASRLLLAFIFVHEGVFLNTNFAAASATSKAGVPTSLSLRLSSYNFLQESRLRWDDIHVSVRSRSPYFVS